MTSTSVVALMSRTASGKESNMSEQTENKDLELEIELEEPKDEEIKIETAPEELEEEVEKAEEPSKPQLSVEDGIEELRAQLEKERNARFEAEKKAREAAEQAKRAEIEAQDTNIQLIDTAIDNLKRDNMLLRQAALEQFEAGNYDKATEFQEKAFANTLKLRELENGKSALEQRSKVKEVPFSEDPVEAFATRLSPRSAEWVRKNPQCVTDPRMYQKMIAAHNMALADGYQADTDDYFSYVEGMLKINKRQETRSEAPAPAAPQRKAAPPAAPVSRSAGSNSPKSDVIRLSKDEREMAESMGMTAKEYALNKLMLIKEGKLPN